ncbi:MAG TPA: membrane protein insertase YidC [Terriglobales bacterium]|nr:membrane protein insertase YidC [Terriglobales bacterium]
MPEYSNPSQEPGSEKRILLVFAITFLGLLAYQFFLSKYGPKPPLHPPQEAQTQPQAQPLARTQATPPAPTAGRATKGASPAVVRQAAAEAGTVVENDLYRIEFTNRGAQVKSWVLKKFTNDQGKPLDLVNAVAAEKFGYPLSLFTYDPNLCAKLNSLLYVASATDTQSAPADLSFEYADSEITVRKTFHFDHSYLVKVEATVTQGGRTVSAFPAWPAGFGDATGAPSYASGRIDYQAGDKVTRLAPDRKGRTISGGNTIPGPFYWAGTLDQYFAAVFLPEDPTSTVLVTLRYALNVPRIDKPVEVLGAAVGSLTGPTRVRLFVGPKSLDVLESIHAPAIAGQAGPDLRGLVDFGMFSIISRPLFLWLRWTYERVVSNWGWAIIVLTVIINVALLPLRLASMRSALKMQKIQPQMQAIKDRYKSLRFDDPKRRQMNEEISALMKEQGVNPAGGCLPMLIQFPFLIAFYTMLGVAIELRNAHWLWLKDLSSADPTHILPIGIIITTFLVQRMTPTGGMDPQQQKVMNLMMPVMLGVISWNLSAGLCLYWTVGNLIAIVQQAIMNRTGLGKEIRDIAGKRARKRALKQSPSRT